MAGPLHRGPRSPGDKVDIRELDPKRRLAIALRRSADLCDRRLAIYTAELMRRAAAAIDPARGLDAWLSEPTQDLPNTWTSGGDLRGWRDP